MKGKKLEDVSTFNKSSRLKEEQVKYPQAADHPQLAIDPKSALDQPQPKPANNKQTEKLKSNNLNQLINTKISMKLIFSYDPSKLYPRTSCLLLTLNITSEEWYYS